MRAFKLAAGASSSRIVDIAGGTTEGVQIAEDVGFGEPDPPAC